MKLIIKEYILHMREKDELDVLLSNILVQKGYVADTHPKTGNRQFGVDIQLHNETELLLVVVKQGNITRDVWSGNKNSVRQSIEEIRDAAIRLLTKQELQKNIRIIVATNGRLDEAVKANWNGYIDANRDWNGIPLEISFMGIDDIVDEVEDNFFNEYLFEESLHSDMRKAMYFVGEGEYKRVYFEHIVDNLIEKIKKAGGSKKKLDRACSSLYLASQMICQFAYDEGIIKIPIIISEYVIIRYWKCMLEMNRLEHQADIEWLTKYREGYEKWNELYIEKIERVVNEKVILPNYDVVENRVLIYEILGYIATYGNYLMECDRDKVDYVINIIILFLNKHKHYVYAPYDVSIGIVIMILRLLCGCDRKDDAIKIIDAQLNVLMRFFAWQGKFPAPSDSYEEAMQIEKDAKSVEYETSAFWGYSLLIMNELGLRDLYTQANDFLEKYLEKVTKCVWFLRKEDEMNFYDAYAMNRTGEGIEILIEDSFENFSNTTNYIMQQYNEEVFSFDKYSFTSLEIIICHYYGYIPRVKFDL